MTSNAVESKRIGIFQQELIKEIPRFPNNNVSLQAMKSKPLSDLLIAYIGWRLRCVAQRPRKVTGQSSVRNDPRAVALKPNIEAFIRAVEVGGDLTPYLSLGHKRGYTPEADPATGGTNTWADKDFLLNVMGLHHFHLGLTMETAGHATRTSEVLFASVTRDKFDILGLFDHAVFGDDNGIMTPERTKLWRAYEAREKAGTLPGQLIFGGYGNLGISTSSQPSAVTIAAIRHVKFIQEIDPKLDDPDFVKTLYVTAAVPQKPMLKWAYRHLDFGLLDKSAGFFGILEKGPN